MRPNAGVYFGTVPSTGVVVVLDEARSFHAFASSKVKNQTGNVMRKKECPSYTRIDVHQSTPFTTFQAVRTNVQTPSECIVDVRQCPPS